MPQAEKSLYRVLTIREIISETTDFRTIVFEDGHGIDYEAGQFLTLVHIDGPTEVRRSYSIVSSPALNEPLAIGVKRVPNGFFSRQLTDNAKVGQQLRTSGAGGFFKLPANPANYTRLVFFAAGSGITPVMSLVKTALVTMPAVQILLVYSGRSRRGTAYVNQLSKLQERFTDRIKIHFLFSTSADLIRARLNRDLFFNILYNETIDIASTMFYTCGPLAYMRMVIYLLEEFGVSVKQIKKEDFIPWFNAPKKEAPPDTGSYYATLHINKQTHKFLVEYPDTVLRAARKNGLLLPYSCETGRCGNCVARRRQGTLWLSNNEVLTDNDIVDGLTLTCVAHPVNGDVELDIPLQLSQ